jgi:hypothetical protein
MAFFGLTVHYFKVPGGTVQAWPSTVQYGTIKTHTAVATLIYEEKSFFKAKKYFRKCKLVRPNFDNGQVVLRPNHHMYQICDLTA